MSHRIDIISIGSLSRNLLWNETGARRSQHATTTLVRVGKRNILIDPGLPAIALLARLSERTGMDARAITDIFLTHVANDSVSGLEAFEHANWWCSEAELAVIASRAHAGDHEAPLVQLASKLKPAPDKLAPGVDLYPLPGYTAGTSGLLVAAAISTTLITGPAVGTLDHFLAGQVLPECRSIEEAKASLQEVYDIADAIVPGYDNLFSNPRGFGQ
jgi:glyoxylase-like metal-dependent hydrolase (beta-lactamase superfamily II)